MVHFLQNSYLCRRKLFFTSTFVILSPCQCRSLVSPHLEVVVERKRYHRKLAYSRLFWGKTNEMNRSEAAQVLLKDFIPQR
jgi:hypothetical protein